jgi:hypothetical protein
VSSAAQSAPLSDEEPDREDWLAVTADHGSSSAKVKAACELRW